ncbi:N-acetylmuramoyl-L-alanine amidase [Oceanobacillus damuensis]|uniref:N-acetylmuramoyl-L-alanine amidase n=1 Tax=Oceanobacillus damuensis TaxID=937928 RepID=UPI00082A11D5|nr:N-acetylmuramoyl-L-alanine amidase [Oceanobacillus damuensis]
MKLYLDPGHGGADPGASGNGLKEKDVVLDIALRIRSILTEKFERVSVKMSRSGDATKTLRKRKDEANYWGADFYLSIHCNAFNSKADGYEDFIHNSLSEQSKAAKYQDILHEEITKMNRLRNRGKKKANLHVLRETTMPAFLSENGFIDNSGDSALMKQDTWKQNIALGHVNGLAKAFNLERKSSDKDTLFKVIAGSFKHEDNADEQVAFLTSKEIEAFVDPVTISGEHWYRVQAGAFRSRQQAESHLQTVSKTGAEAFIIDG